eukprot:g66102.t1
MGFDLTAEFGEDVSQTKDLGYVGAILAVRMANWSWSLPQPYESLHLSLNDIRMRFWGVTGLKMVWLFFFWLPCITCFNLWSSSDDKQDVAKDKKEGAPENKSKYVIEWEGKPYHLPSANVPAHQRKPGKLLLNMLTKNEAEHLDRTLPKWKKIIDCWIIGIDDANTDNSEEIIAKHLKGIPGETVVVHFDGMGPTWSQLVQVGIKKYPLCTHGIIADADYMPMKSTLNKMELDVRCSKHMYTIWTQDHKNERKMDWIYRNIPGAMVKRRTHQIVEVPELPDQEVFQTLIDLPIEEREGGYGDRTGKKSQRYIEFLEADLLDYPNDTRTLYYLAYAHFEIFNANHRQPQQEHWDHLTEAVKYFKQRAQLTEGNKEELWFTLLKLGEIYERFYNDWTVGEAYYTNCTKLDGERADAFFYLGQHYRLHRLPSLAMAPLKTAATLPMPERSLFQWHYLYSCIAQLEYLRNVKMMFESKYELENAVVEEAIKIGKAAKCTTEENAKEEMNTLLSFLTAEIDKSKGKKKKKATKIGNIQKLLNWINKHFDYLEMILSKKETGSWDAYRDQASSLFSDLVGPLVYMREVQDRYLSLKEKDTEAAQSYLTCRVYRRATTPYLKFFTSASSQLEDALGGPSSKVWQKWQKTTQDIRAMCR